MQSDKHRRLLRERKSRLQQRKVTSPAEVSPRSEQKPKTIFGRIYRDHYKMLFLITIALLLFSIITIGVTYAKTGDIIYKGVSLSGGLTLTIPTGETPLAVDEVTTRLATQFPEADIVIREISEFGVQSALTIEAATPTNSQESLDVLQEGILSSLAKDIPDIHNTASVEIVGPSLGASFFRQTAKAVFIAFVFMGLVVFLYFGETNNQKAGVGIVSIVASSLIWYSNSWAISILAGIFCVGLIVLYARYSIPSLAVILAALSTILFTIAIVDILQMRISTAGIAAFLMLIGYSVDTDILLSNRVLKRSEGTVYSRIVSTVKTGLTMTGTTLAASLIALLFAQSAVIKEIMLIICIGLVADVLYTWIQNAGLLRLYLEHKDKKVRR